MRLRPRLLIVTLIAIAGIVPAWADKAAVSDGIRACDSDIHRLCQAVYPDEKLVASCLVRRRAELSRACAEMLANPPDDADMPEGDD